MYNSLSIFLIKCLIHIKLIILQNVLSYIAGFHFFTFQDKSRLLLLQTIDKKDMNYIIFLHCAFNQTIL